LPPHNEPFGENNGQWQADDLIGKLNEITDTTYQFGESLFKRLFKKTETT